MPFHMPRNPFGRYSLPNVLGRLFHHNGGTEGPSTYPISQVGPLNPGTINYQGGFNTGGFTNPNVDSSVDPNTGLPTGGFTTPTDFHTTGITHAPNIGTGHSTNGGGGLYTSGTLGGGTAVDPSVWGQIFNDGPQDITGNYQYSGRGNEGGFMGQGNGLLGSGFFRNRQRTGGNLPAQNGGINPGGMYTGGNQPAQVFGMGTGGNLPPQGMGMGTGGAMPPQQYPPKLFG